MAGTSVILCLYFKTAPSPETQHISSAVEMDEVVSEESLDVTPQRMSPLGKKKNTCCLFVSRWKGKTDRLDKQNKLNNHPEILVEF